MALRTVVPDPTADLGRTVSRPRSNGVAPRRHLLYPRGMTPRRAPIYLALIVAMLVALIAPAAIADDAIPPEGEPPTTTTVPASTTTTTSIPPTTTTTTTVVAEPPPAVAPPTDDEEPPVPPEAAPEPPPPAEALIEPETPPGDREPAESEEEEIEFDPLDPEQVTRDIVFPVVGASTFSKGFGDCRDGCRRSHNGIDILTHRWKGSPVVAAHDGRVTLTRTGGKLSGWGPRAGEETTRPCHRSLRAAASTRLIRPPMEWPSRILGRSPNLSSTQETMAERSHVHCSWLET